MYKAWMKKNFAPNEITSFIVVLSKDKKLGFDSFNMLEKIMIEATINGTITAKE